MIRPDDLAQVLRIEALRQRRRADQVAEHHGQLAPLSLCPHPSLPRKRGRVREGAQHSDSVEQAAAMSAQHHAKVLEIVRGELGQRLPVNLVLAKRRLVALKTETS
jgi:hypothetical protein